MRNFKCSNCAQPLRALTLSGHYGRQVEVDVCDPCCLIWFDDVESVRISKPGIAELVRVVHTAMSGGSLHGSAASLAAAQHCPVCAARLKQVYNATRYGRTSQLQCPNGHGYYQSYILYLAEKGFVRPILWPDIRALIREAKELFCGNCGGALELRPQEECPYCRSSIGVLDPARLASAVDAGPAPEAAKRDQMACHACGGPVDPTSDTRCPQCSVALRRQDTQTAVDAISRPKPREQRKKVIEFPSDEAIKAAHLPDSNRGAHTEVAKRVILLLVLGFMLMLVRGCFQQG